MTVPSLRGHRRVAVRIAPSLRFTYVERKLLPLFLLFWPPAAAPSLLADAMPLGEFAARMLRGCQFPPLVYHTREFYYMQTPLWPALLPDVDLVGPPFSAVTCPGTREDCRPCKCMCGRWPGSGVTKGRSRSCKERGSCICMLTLCRAETRVLGSSSRTARLDKRARAGGV